MMDARVMCGHDVRRSGVWPSDSARMDAFVSRNGGTLTAYPVGNVAIALQWDTKEGETRTTTGSTIADAFARLQTLIDIAPDV